MVEKVITLRRNVVEFACYRADRPDARAPAILARFCRHCGAVLSEGENEDDCSSAFNVGALRQFGTE